MTYGCIGRKLKHSFSKEIHNKLADYSYELIELEPDDIYDFFINKNFKAINVTIPYKETVIAYLDHIDENAKSIGAVNTIVNKDGQLFGYNTDFLGMKLLIENAGISLENKKVLILGSGGTSKTAFAVASSLGAKEIKTVSRGNAENFITYEEAHTIHNDSDIIINTTPVGMYPNINEMAIDIDKFPRLSGVIDAIYNPLRSLLIVKAKEKGISAIGGLYMLVAQAAFACELFIGESVEDKIDTVYNSLLKQKENIVLTGMPGSGKTTIGNMLAEKLGMEFIDTDKIIEQNENRSIPEIIKNDGEKAFRDIETKAVFSVSSLQNKVIATGGGVVLRDENIHLLKQNGKIYFLDRNIDDIVPTADRPLTSDYESLKKRYEERYKIYTKTADRQILNQDAKKTAEEIIKDFNL